MARGLTADILDGLSSSTAIKGPASIAFTTNVALSGEVTAQGFTTSESRVLVTGNTDPKENGLWRTSTGDWSRCKDFSRNDDVRPGTIVNVIEGDYFGPWAVVCDDDPVIMDVTSITFQHFPDWLGIEGYVDAALLTRGVAYTLAGSLVDRATGQFRTTPTLAAGDVKVSKDFGAYANITTLPTVAPAGGSTLQISLSAAEMTADVVLVKFQDQAGAEWNDVLFVINTIS